MKLELNKVYRDRAGQEWRIICKFESGNVLAINPQQNQVNNVNEDGCYLLTQECERDLIELVGDDFTDNLRYFELNGILIGLIEDIQRIRNQDFAKNKISKWNVIMKELSTK